MTFGIAVGPVVVSAVFLDRLGRPENGGTVTHVTSGGAVVPNVNDPGVGYDRVVCSAYPCRRAVWRR